MNTDGFGCSGTPSFLDGFALISVGLHGFVGICMVLDGYEWISADWGGFARCLAWI